MLVRPERIYDRLRKELFIPRFGEGIFSLELEEVLDLTLTTKRSLSTSEFGECLKDAYQTFFAQKGMPEGRIIDELSQESRKIVNSEDLLVSENIVEEVKSSRIERGDVFYDEVWSGAGDYRCLASTGVGTVLRALILRERITKDHLKIISGWSPNTVNSRIAKLRKSICDHSQTHTLEADVYRHGVTISYALTQR